MTTEDDMVERVAMALAANVEEGFPRFVKQSWDQYTELARTAFRLRARVAIEAMREPTQTMLDATGNGECGRWAPGVWITMVDAALAFPRAGIESDD